MKRFIHLLFALAMFSLFLAFDLTDPFVPSAAAETVPQMRLRIFADAQTRHPDVWNGCDKACVDARVKSAPWLPGLAKQASVGLDDLAKYAVVRSFEWGQNFENLYGRPPTQYDWVNAYADMGEQVRYEVAASPVLFAVNEWSERRYYRLKLEYGGSY